MRPHAETGPLRRSLLTRGHAGSSLLAAALSFVAAASQPAYAGEPRDFTFFLSSDPHVGLMNKKADPPVTAERWAAQCRDRVAQIINTVGEPYPAEGPLRGMPPAKVARPLGFLIAGDLTDAGDDPAQWPRFETVFPAGGLADGTIPLFLGAGNHDGGPAGATRAGLVARNRAAAKAGRITSVAENGLHYAWKWHDVHFVCVNLCPADSTDPDTPFRYGRPGPGSWNDPLAALSFLSDYLRTAVGTSKEPVIIWQHYGYCEGFNFDWNWWSAKQRRTFYDAIEAYNVVALLHGHTHAAEHYRWPDPERNPKEVVRLFGDDPPRKPRSFPVFSGGSISAGTFYVFRVVGDQLVAAHRGPDGWSKETRLHGVQSLGLPAGAGQSTRRPQHPDMLPCAADRVRPERPR